MPIYDITCRACGRHGEVIVPRSDSPLVCPACGSSDTDKGLTTPSGLTGRTPKSHPGPSDHGCCGSRPSQAGCAGPGSCCGRRQG